jgi:hypothetical protein
MPIHPKQEEATNGMPILPNPRRTTVHLTPIRTVIVAP